jgi:hypothetical protein
MIYTYSQFYYGFQVVSEPYNGYIDVNEGSGEVSIAVPVGSYTLQTLADAVREALLSQGTLNYTVSVDRATRRFTIAADAPFSILINTGTHNDASIYTLLGFNGTANLTGFSTYSGDAYSGQAYVPQFKLQSYISPDDWQESNQASVNVASTGTTVEVVNFGLAKFIQFDIKFITNRFGDGLVVKNNHSGIEDARAFLQNITQKNYFEFMPDMSNPNFYYKVILESTPDYADGTGYKLKELFDKNLPDVYETGILKLRVIE